MFEEGTDALCLAHQRNARGRARRRL